MGGSKVPIFLTILSASTPSKPRRGLLIGGDPPPPRTESLSRISEATPPGDSAVAIPSAHLLTFQPGVGVLISATKRLSRHLRTGEGTISLSQNI